MATRLVLCAVAVRAQFSYLSTLDAADGAAADLFGISVALNQPSSVAFIGAYQKSFGPKDQAGAAYIFSRSGAKWSQAAEMVPSDSSAEAFFGYSGSLTASGTTVLIGAVQDSNITAMQGACYVFNNVSGGWTQTVKLIDPLGTPLDSLGYSAAIAADGSFALCGAIEQGPTSNGGVLMWRFTGGAWVPTPAQYLTASDGLPGDFFGYSMAMSSDSTQLVIGATHTDTPPILNHGSVYYFTRSGGPTGVWTQQVRLNASDQDSEDWFGYATSMSADGTIVLAGAPYKNINESYNQGAAYIFTRSGGVWNQTQQLIAYDGAQEDFFGSSVALSGDGRIAAVGAYGKQIGTNAGQGATYVYVNNGTMGWALAQVLYAPDGSENSYFGYGATMGMAGDDGSEHYMSGAYYQNENGLSAEGAVYVYRTAATASATPSSSVTPSTSLSATPSTSYSSTASPTASRSVVPPPAAAAPSNAGSVAGGVIGGLLAAAVLGGGVFLYLSPAARAIVSARLGGLRIPGFGGGAAYTPLMQNRGALAPGSTGLTAHPIFAAGARAYGATAP